MRRITASLLGVLLAEVGDVGLDRVEELGDDGGDAAEVRRGRAARGRRQSTSVRPSTSTAVAKPSG